MPSRAGLVANLPGWLHGTMPNRAIGAPKPVMLAVDGNSLLHRAYHSMGGALASSPSGKPSWALRGVWNQLILATARVPVAAVRIAFDSTSLHRRAEFADYKAHRAIKPPMLLDQLAAAVPHFQRAGLHTVQLAGYEADDVLASTAAANTAAGWDTIVVTSDRDAFALISDSVRVLRVVNGGIAGSPLLDRIGMFELTGVYPQGYPLYAALRGDPSDNLEGVAGIGAKGAQKIVTALAARGGDVQEQFAQLNTAQATAMFGRAIAGKLAGPDVAVLVRRNLALMSMCTDLPVGPVGDAELPLDEPALLYELGSWGMESICVRAISALCPLRLSTDGRDRTGFLDEPATVAIEVREPQQQLLFD